jgi:hypothetical protein
MAEPAQEMADDGQKQAIKGRPCELLSKVGGSKAEEVSVDTAAGTRLVASAQTRSWGAANV